LNNFVTSGVAHHKRSAGTCAIQLGGIADLQPERLSISEPERESQFGRPSRTVSRLFGKSAPEFERLAIYTAIVFR